MQPLNRSPGRARHAVPLVAGRSVAPGVLAVLHEVKAALERYAACGEPAVIDLRWLAAMPVQLEQLRFALGEGALCATVHAMGVSQVRETGIAGVWWTSRRDGPGGTQSEVLEIVGLPALLRGGAQAVDDGIGELRARLAALEGYNHGLEQRAAAPPTHRHREEVPPECAAPAGRDHPV